MMRTTDVRRSRSAIVPAILLAILAGACALAPLLQPATVLGTLGLDAGNAIARAHAQRSLLHLRFLALPLIAAAALLLAPAAGQGLARFRLESKASARRVRDVLRIRWSRVSSRERLLLVGLTVLGLGMRLRFLGRPLLWDEGTTFFEYGIRPWWISLAWYPEPNNHVLHSVLASLSTWLFGPTLWAFRLPALVCGTLQIPATWLVTRLVAGRNASIVAAALVATSSVLTGFSVNARGYAVIGLLLLLLLATAALLRERDELVLWIAFVILASLGLFTVPIMLFAIAFVTVWMLAGSLAGDSGVNPTALLRRLIVAGLATAALTLALYAPVLVVSGPGTLFANRFVLPLAWPDFFASWPHVLAETAAQWSANVPRWLAIAFVFALVPALPGVTPDHRGRIPLAVGLAGPLVLVFLTRTAPQPRIWSILAPVYLGLVGAGLVAWGALLSRPLPRPARPLLAGAALAGLVAILGVRTATATILISRDIETESMPGGTQVATFLSIELRAGDAVVTTFPSTRVLRYELMRIGLDGYLATPVAEVRRALVVVNRSRGQAGPDRVLEQSGLRARVVGPGRLLFEHGVVGVWEFDVAPCPGANRATCQPG